MVSAPGAPDPDLTIKLREWLRLAPCGVPAVAIWLVPPPAKPAALLLFLASVPLFWMVSARPGLELRARWYALAPWAAALAAVALAWVGEQIAACVTSFCATAGLLALERRYSMLDDWRADLRARVTLRLGIVHLTSLAYAYGAA
ncbi:MAG: hypothetical protein ISN29_12660 [Gammaproteobacteria bacterium AqS3]|nr:hypothetical protein [Gammaproteobacteria bacterium AqS3]